MVTSMEEINLILVAVLTWLTGVLFTVALVALQVTLRLDRRLAKQTAELRRDSKDWRAEMRQDRATYRTEIRQEDRATDRQEFKEFQAETRQNFKTVNDRFDEIEKRLADSEIQDARIKGSRKRSRSTRTGRAKASS